MQEGTLDWHLPVVQEKMQLKHIATLLLPLAAGVAALPIQPRFDTDLLNVLGTSGTSNPMEAVGPQLLGILKRDAEAIDHQEKRDPAGTLNVLSEIGGPDVGNTETGGGLLGGLGIFKRQGQGLGPLTSLMSGLRLPIKLPLVAGIQRRSAEMGEVEQ